MQYLYPPRHVRWPNSNLADTVVDNREAVLWINNYGQRIEQIVTSESWTKRLIMMMSCVGLVRQARCGGVDLRRTSSRCDWTARVTKIGIDSNGSASQRTFMTVRPSDLTKAKCKAAIDAIGQMDMFSLTVHREARKATVQESLKLSYSRQLCACGNKV